MWWVSSWLEFTRVSNSNFASNSTLFRVYRELVTRTHSYPVEFLKTRWLTQLDDFDSSSTRVCQKQRSRRVLLSILIYFTTDINTQCSRMRVVRPNWISEAKTGMIRKWSQFYVSWWFSGKSAWKSVPKVVFHSKKGQFHLKISQLGAKWPEKGLLGGGPPRPTPQRPKNSAKLWVFAY